MNIILKLSKNISKVIIGFSNYIAKMVVKSHQTSSIVMTQTYKNLDEDEAIKQNWNNINNDFSTIGNDMRKAIIKHAK
jgi:hypothetical protein